jgi:hypothetical protein
LFFGSFPFKSSVQLHHFSQIITLPSESSLAAYTFSLDIACTFA